MKKSLESSLQLSEEVVPLVEQLKADNLPVVLWGCGSLSYNTRKMLEYNGICIDAVWVDVKQARNSIEAEEMQFEEIVERFGVFNVVCGHSRYDLAKETENKYREINKIYCFVNICYGRWERISKSFILDHLNDYEYIYNLLEDQLSRDCMSAYLNCKNTEDYTYIIPYAENRASYFDNPFFDISNDEVYLDLGAYDGDSIREFIQCSDCRYKEIIAMEPEAKSYNKLLKYINDSGIQNVSTFENGCWDDNKTLRLDLNEESSSISDEGAEIEVRRIDDQFKNKGITLIKINYLNGVVETIKGAKETLKKYKPNIVVTVGFDEWGVINIPRIIKEINPDYKLSLRYASPMPARLLLFAY